MNRDRTGNRAVAFGVAGVAILLAGCGGDPVRGPLQEAREALEAGEPASARALLDGVDASAFDEPGQARYYRELGVAAWRTGDLDTAVIAFENSRKLDPTLPGPAYNLGVIMKGRDNAFRAASLFREAAELDPGDPRPLEQQALIEMDAGRWVEAETLLLEALDRDPGSARIRTTLGVVSLRTRGPGAALTNLLSAVEADDGYAPAYFNLATLHRDWLGDPESGIRYMETYLTHTDRRSAEALSFIELARLGREPVGEPAPRPVDPDPGLLLPDPVDMTSPPAGTAPAGAPTVPDVPDVPDVPEPFDTGDVTEVATVAPPPPPPEPAGEPSAPPVRPRTVDGLLALARRQSAEGNTAEAYRSCREARALALRQGNRAEADRILPLAVTLCRDQAAAHYDYGVFLMNGGEAAAALPSFKRTVALAPDWVPAYLGMAEAAVRTGQNDAAFVALQRALRIQPDHREAMWGLATLYDRGLRDPDKALRAYEAFLSLHGGDSRSAQARARVIALQNTAGPAPGPAPATPRQMTVIRPDPVVANPAAEPEPLLRITRPRVRNSKAAVESYNRGTIYQAREDWDQAIFFYTRALEQDDTFALAYYNLGKVYQSQGRTGLAAEAYREAIRLQPSHVDSRFNLAGLYREQGRADAAVDQLVSILQLDPGHARAHMLLGLIYSGNRNTQAEAVRYFQQFLRLSPNDPAAPEVRRWLAGTRP